MVRTTLTTIGQTLRGIGRAVRARPGIVWGVTAAVSGFNLVAPLSSPSGVRVLPVVGLAFTGLSSGTLMLFPTLSRISIAVVLAAMSAAVAWSGWRVGGVPRPA